MEEIREERTLPHSRDAERSVLGSMLMDRDALELALEQLFPEDFYIPGHETLFTAMRDLRNASSAVDLITVSAELKRFGKVEQAGGLSYISELLSFVPTTANVLYYIKLVEEKSIQRALIRAGGATARDGMNEEKTAEDSLNDAERRIYEISMRRKTDSLASASEIMPAVSAQIAEYMNASDRLRGVDTGFRDLNEVTGGFQQGHLIVIAGRPGMGKSSFAMNIAQYAALHDNRSVVTFSLEMTKEELMLRMICSEASVSSKEVQEGKLGDEESRAIMHAMPKFSESKLFIDDTGGATVTQIRSKCRRLQARSGLDMVIVDYMQLMTAAGTRKSDSRQQDISDMSRQFKLLARELNVPVLLLSQLNREAEKGDKHEPKLSHLRESGSIEQDADLVILLYRPQVYDESLDNTSQIIIAKNRHGETKKVYLAWQGEYTRFMNLAREFVPN